LDPTELVGSVVRDADFEALAQGKRVLLSAEVPIPKIRANRDLLASAVENVVRNAIRYTAPGTAVEVLLSASSEGEGILLRIRDRGPGVPEEELENLFRPFYRVDSARDRERGGMGLGLAIAWRAVRLHEGRIAAVNRPEGGLEVTVSIPRAKEPDAPTTS
jgi:two-component system sensor histidine kinase CpxA